MSLSDKKIPIIAISAIVVIIAAGLVFIVFFNDNPQPTIEVNNDADLGDYLVDSNGMTLYYFTKDTPGNATGDPTSVCLGGCVANWPLFSEEVTTAGSGLDSNDFTTFTRSDGETQTAYRGWPLYYYTPDTNSGDTLGENVGSVWYVMKPDYNFMLQYKNEFENYFVDSFGMTLYYFTKDTPGNVTVDPVSTCLGGCVANWPLFQESNIISPSLLNKTDFTTFTRSDGETQTAYRGWPLYYYTPDTNSGDTLGDNVGSVWYVMKPNYNLMLMFNTTINGNYLVDSNGFTLYNFTNDTPGTTSADPISACLGGCVANWPLFQESSIIAPSAVNTTDFTTFTRSDGETQTAYKGWPLYYFTPDTNPGDTKGEGVGGVWFVMVP